MVAGNRLINPRAPGRSRGAAGGAVGFLHRRPLGRIALAPLLLLLLAVVFPLRAEETTAFRTIEVEARNTLIKGADIDEWDFFGLGSGELDFQSQGSRWVRARLNLRADILEVAGAGSVTQFTVPRAFVRTRFPLGDSYLFRTTFGKSRVTWGDGALYNAGDLVFGAEGRRADLFSTGAIRDETDWLITAFFPLGRFSFIEPVVLVPEANQELAPLRTGGGDSSGGEDSADALLLSGGPTVNRTALGSRLQWKLWNIKMESAYLFRGAAEEHETSFSLQGNIGPDVYAGVATTSGDGVDADEELRVTGGLFHQHRYGSISAITLRLEALFDPEIADGEQELSFFPEVTWSPSESVVLFARAVVAARDPSALWISGGEWNMYQGLTLGSYLTVQSGGAGDRYGFERPGGAAVTTTVR